MKHIPRKRFGQHFLADQGIIEAIVQAIDPKPSDKMVEIGPGLGAMTLPLVQRLGHLTVIELDRDLAARLHQRPELTVIEADVLRVDFAALATETQFSAGPSPVKLVPQGGSNPRSGGAWGPSLRVVGNLPYNISSPILFHLLECWEHIVDQHFMLQKEVIDRMVAVPATAAYGRLSVMLQWRYAMQNVLFVPPQSFEPPPRVDSAVVRMLPRLDAVALDVNHLSTVVRVAFSQRRKLLRHSLGRWLEENNFAGQFDLQRRAEEVPVDAYLELARETAKSKDAG